jgi:hypothetical protein
MLSSCGRVSSTSPPRKQRAKRQLQTQNSHSIRQLQAPKLPSPHSTLKPQPHHPGRRGSGTRDRDIIRLPFEEAMSKYLIRPRRVPRPVERLATGTRFCISRFVLHIRISFFTFSISVFSVPLSSAYSRLVVYLSDQISLAANNGGV